MRLTLRTLLAYMDGMLDPEDEKALDAKIQESEFATDLVQRIRNAMKQLRLGAPKPDAKGANAANLVADYLDGTLPEEQISNFERMCLDSDLNLSEVAACHQILMRVLGEPAHVSPELRERIYRAPEVAEKAAQVQAPPVQARDEDVITKKDVEELVAPTSNRTLVPAIVGLVAAIAILIVLIVWPFGGPSPLASLMGSKSAEQDPGLDDPGTPESGAPGGAATGAQGGDSGETPAGDEGAPTGDSDSPPTGGQTPSGDADGGVTSGGAPGEAAQGAGGEVNPGAGTGAPPMPTPDAGSDSGTGASTPMPEPAKSGDTATDVALTPPTTDDTGAETATTEVAATAEIGRFTNAQQLLLRLEADAWMRVGNVNLLRERDVIACPPYYRPSIALVNGVQLIFAGPSNATMIRRDENDTPTIGLERGRVVLATSGKAGAATVLAVKDRQARITFGDAESEVAVEVRDYVQPGADLENPARQKVIEVYPLGGSITWTEGDSETVIRPGQVLAMTDTQPVQAYALPTPPEWTATRVASSVAKRAAETLEPAVLEGRPASLSLQEKVAFRQQETVALAIDTLCQIGEVEHAIRTFSNDKQHAYWPMHVQALRDEIARSPEAAKQVRDALAAIHAEDADRLYAMIIGYSNAQLADGKAGELVAALESEQMPLRVLAYENLKRITGRSNFYQAQKSAERQRDKVRFWKGLADENQVIYPVPPAPLPSRDPLR